MSLIIGYFVFLLYLLIIVAIVILAFMAYSAVGTMIDDWSEKKLDEKYKDEEED